MVRLETERLLLRPFCEQDLDAYATIVSDEETMQFMGGTVDRGTAWRHIAFALGHWQIRGFGSWAVERKADTRFIGRVGFLQTYDRPDFEMGWLLGREYWGHGYATEAAHGAIEFAFRKLGKDHVISLIHPENQRSARVAERLGESVVGHTTLEDEFVLVYGLSAG